jgi:N-methylhydantoinase A/oxoprolinase/acetone carboxylase beta subunit
VKPSEHFRVSELWLVCLSCCTWRTAILTILRIWFTLLFPKTDSPLVDGTLIAPLNVAQLKEQASIIRSKSIPSIVVIGIYSPSNPAQEEEAKSILAAELGPDYDISCSHAIGRLGFLERENASILNASLRRFARHVIAGFSFAVRRLGRCKLYITLNDGTLSKASTAAEYPVRCFSSGPTNSARGAALLAQTQNFAEEDDREVLVVDVGG